MNEINDEVGQEPPFIESPLCGPVERNGLSVELQIYGDGEGRWILELVDEEQCSHVWDDRFETDNDAYAEALRALDEAPQEFAASGASHPRH